MISFLKEKVLTGRFFKRSFLVIVLLLMGDLSFFFYLSHTNQAKLQGYLTGIQSQSLEELAWQPGQTSSFELSENAWPLYQGSLGVIPMRDFERLFELREASGLTRETSHFDEYPFEEVNGTTYKKLEDSLDQVHGIMNIARQQKRSFPILDYSLGLKLVLPHLNSMRSFSYLSLFSAYRNLKSGDPQKAVDRVVDGLHLTRRLIAEPFLVSNLVKNQIYEQSASHLSLYLQQYPQEGLKEILAELEPVDLINQFEKAISSELFIVKEVFDSVIDFYIPFASTWIQLDKATSLNKFITFVSRNYQVPSEDKIIFFYKALEIQKNTFWDQKMVLTNSLWSALGSVCSSFHVTDVKLHLLKWAIKLELFRHSVRQKDSYVESSSKLIEELSRDPLITWRGIDDGGGTELFSPWLDEYYRLYHPQNYVAMRIVLKGIDLQGIHLPK